MAKQTMLTTADNPFDPFTQFDEWYSYDESQGYHTSGLVARFALTSDELSITDQHLAIEQAINEIIVEGLPGDYRKVSKEFEE